MAPDNTINVQAMRKRAPTRMDDMCMDELLFNPLMSNGRDQRICASDHQGKYTVSRTQRQFLMEE